MARLQDLLGSAPIVNPDGTPTQYLMRLLQVRGALQGDDHTLLEVLLSRYVAAGLGIDVTNGAFSAEGNIIIAADIQELLDSIGNTRGTILYRGASGWVGLAPGTSGFALITGGPGADPSWASVSANIQTLLDSISSTRGVILYRGASGWAALSPGTDGDVLTTHGASADPTWSPPTGGGGGTSFPSAPGTNDRFYRTDRNVEYYYDGTRWLSTHLFTLIFANQESLNPVSATGSLRAANPHSGDYSVYVEKFKVAMYNTTTIASNYFTVQLKSTDAGVATNLGSAIVGNTGTINQWESYSSTVNAAIASTVDALTADFTETGTAVVYMTAAMTYRLVG